MNSPQANPKDPQNMNELRAAIYSGAISPAEARAIEKHNGWATSDAAPPTLTPDQVKKAAPGVFTGTNGRTYEKLPNGQIRAL